MAVLLKEKEVEQYGGKESVVRKDLQDLGKITSALASDTANLISENASHFYGKGMNQAKKIEMSLEKQIQQNPVRSLLIVAGIGLVLGALWNRR